MAQVLDSGPAASSALGQPDKDDNTGPMFGLKHVCPLTHVLSRYTDYRQGSGALSFVVSLFLFPSKKQKSLCGLTKTSHPKAAIKKAFSAMFLSF